MTIALVLQSNTAAQLKLQHYTYKFKKKTNYTRNTTNHRNDSKYIHVNKIAVKIWYSWTVKTWQGYAPARP